jgi:hypothetical protein
MDRLSLAQAVLSAAADRSPAVVLPGCAPSPMDSWDTMPVPRSLIESCDAAAAALRGSAPRDMAPDGMAADGTVLDAEMLRAATGVPPAGTGRRPA